MLVLKQSDMAVSIATGSRGMPGSRGKYISSDYTINHGTATVHLSFLITTLPHITAPAMMTTVSRTSLHHLKKC